MVTSGLGSHLVYISLSSLHGISAGRDKPVTPLLLPLSGRARTLKNPEHPGGTFWPLCHPLLMWYRTCTLRSSKKRLMYELRTLPGSSYHRLR